MLGRPAYLSRAANRTSLVVAVRLEPENALAGRMTVEDVLGIVLGIGASLPDSAPLAESTAAEIIRLRWEGAIPLVFIGFVGGSPALSVAALPNVPGELARGGDA